MPDQEEKGSHCYPSNIDDPDQLDVLRNKFGIKSLSVPLKLS